ncbi:ACT domain-containing protein [Shimia sp. MMG029]|uniref:ACT domain-containing protein n=1 Tax=Shimia sp. MMG029 TaxID=3021978 RepID=UPI0022FE2D20|nr:ACT domain-containing protein [Shimia sp. MMG029]
MRLKHISGHFAVAKLPPEAALPSWFTGRGFSAMVRADDELTLVCEAQLIPQEVTAQRGWACFRTLGPFAFDEAGIVAALIAPISAAGIGVFVLCTFDGEHILVPSEHFDRVQNLLIAQGHEFVA